jgi:hypothetical protein
VSLAMNLGGGSFGPWRHYATGEEPSAVVAADFDGEGGADLACANRRARDVSILLNHGGGVLAGAASLPCPVTPTSAAAADLNGDGNTDLIAGCANQGAGRFSVPESLGIGPHALQVAVADLDGDGDEDLSAGVDSASSVVILWNEGVSPARSRDANANGVPDECEARPFRRGDPDGSGNVDLTDPIYLLGFLFLGGEKPACAETADADNDGRMAIADAIMLLDFLFRGGQPPGAPGPFAGSCGTDPDPPGSAGDLGCEAYGGCGER